MKRAAASAAFTVMFSSFLAFINNYLSGVIGLVEVIYFMILAFIGSYSVANLLLTLVKKYKKDSLSMIVLLGVLGWALVMLTLTSIYGMYIKPELIYKFGRFC